MHFTVLRLPGGMKELIHFALRPIEMLFDHLKRNLKLGRLRLRGPFGARDEFLLAATA